MKRKTKVQTWWAIILPDGSFNCDISDVAWMWARRFEVPKTWIPHKAKLVKVRLVVVKS